VGQFEGNLAEGYKGSDPHILAQIRRWDAGELSQDEIRGVLAAMLAEVDQGLSRVRNYLDIKHQVLVS